MKRLFRLITATFILSAIIWMGLLFTPISSDTVYRMKVGKGQGVASVAKTLKNDSRIYSRYVLVGTAYLLGIHNRLHTGTYKMGKRFSTWDILKRLKSGRPDTITIRILEGMKFSQMRSIIDKTADISHDTSSWSNQKLLETIDNKAAAQHPEGLFFPDSYEIEAGSSDLQIYRLAYQTMQRHLSTAWDERQSGLPYQNPYELLIMASLIEKETAHADDRRHVAAVFVNRLNTGMRLQTDPTVIYGMGERYQGKIRKADLRRDTPYNTYTRHGLTPTPIALPGKAALEAAAHPSSARYLYFVSKMDGTGRSYFSHDLDEHNVAVRKYILKKP